MNLAYCLVWSISNWPKNNCVILKTDMLKKTLIRKYVKLNSTNINLQIKFYVDSSLGV